MPMNNGKVYIVGAGPGNLRLMTVEALQLIQKVDVILVDELVGPDILKLCNESRKDVILVGKRGGSVHSFPQAEIEKLMIELSCSGKVLLRLKGGCPSLFARTFEETEVLTRHGIKYEIIPGITAMSAASCYGELALTKRGEKNHIEVFSGHNEEELPDLKFLPSRTLVFYMGIHKIQKIISRLLQNDWPEEIILTVISNASLYNQKKHEMSLKEWKDYKGEIARPALIILQRSQTPQSWFEEKRRVLFTGTRDGNEVFSGCEVINRPMIQTVLKKQDLPDLGRFTHLVFMSKHSVQYFFELLRINKKDLRSLVSLSLVAIGKITAKELIEGEKVFLSQSDFFESGELFIESVSENFKCLVIRSYCDNDLFSNELKSKILLTEVFEAYEVVTVNGCIDVDFKFIDEIYFTAPVVAKSFFERYQISDKIRLSAVGDSTKSAIWGYHILKNK